MKPRFDEVFLAARDRKRPLSDMALLGALRERTGKVVPIKRRAKA